MRRTPFGLPPPRTPPSSYSSSRGCIPKTPNSACSSSSSSFLRKGIPISRRNSPRSRFPKCSRRLVDSFKDKENLPPFKEWPPSPSSKAKLEDRALKSSDPLSFEGQPRRHVLRPQFRVFKDESKGHCPEDTSQKDQNHSNCKQDINQMSYSELDYLLSQHDHPTAVLKPSGYGELSCGLLPQAKKEFLVPSVSSLEEGRWSPNARTNSSILSSTPIRL